MPEQTPYAAPAALIWAARVVLVEGLLLVVLGVLDIAQIASGRVLLGVTAGIFFVAYGVGLGLCARGLRAARRWARGPVLFTQLAMLGFAWNLAQAHRWAFVVALVVLAGVTLGCLLQPTALSALEGSGDDDG